MPDNNSSAAQPEPETSPGEFDFAKSETEIPRIKRRSLKPQPQTVLKPLSATPTEAAEKIESAAKAKESSPAHSVPAPAPPSSPSPRASTESSGARIASTTNPTTSPHGTRPATLYYSQSNGPRRDKEETTPMKPTTTAAPASSSTPQSSSVPARTTASVTRPGVVDYRTNVERQAREQKSVGNILAYLVYTLIALFVIGAALAGYGAYAVSKQLRQQSMTVDELDSRLSAKNVELEQQLTSTMATLTEAQGQISRQQDLILKQQEAISKLVAASQDQAAALRTERATRAEETASLRARLRDVEYKGPITQKY